uniref:Uncharacterized protein n=1 Tax=Anguilla anguilla TaxID=7936 RepID=A0A0E9RWH8_ANGAN
MVVFFVRVYYSLSMPKNLNVITEQNER